MYVLPSTFGSATTTPAVNAFMDELDALLEERYVDLLESDLGHFYFSGETPTPKLDEARREIYVQTVEFRKRFRCAASRCASKLWLYSPRAGEAINTYVQRENAASALALEDAVTLGGLDGPIVETTLAASQYLDDLAAEETPFALLGAVYAFGTVRPRMAAVFMEAERRRQRSHLGTRYARALAEEEVERTVQVGHIVRLTLDENPQAESPILRGAEGTFAFWPVPFLDHGRAVALARRG